MYYLGTPFIEIKKILKADIKEESCFYVQVNSKIDFADSIIERINYGKLDYVFYNKGNSNDSRIKDYHYKNYKSIPYFVEEYITDYVIKESGFKAETIYSYKITHYLDDWRVKIEQIYDSNYELQEYREMYYDGKNEIPFEEKIFFPSSWTIHKEEY
jgi:hypothetical protein